MQGQFAGTQLLEDIPGKTNCPLTSGQTSHEIAVDIRSKLAYWTSLTDVIELLEIHAINTTGKIGNICKIVK